MNEDCFEWVIRGGRGQISIKEIAKQKFQSFGSLVKCQKRKYKLRAGGQ